MIIFYRKLLSAVFKRILLLALYKFASYFENQVLRKRPYIKKEWCIRIIEDPMKIEEQDSERFRFWGIVHELENKIIRVVTLKDKLTIHNAFPDRSFKL